MISATDLEKFLTKLVVAADADYEKAATAYKNAANKNTSAARSGDMSDANGRMRALSAVLEEIPTLDTHVPAPPKAT